MRRRDPGGCLARAPICPACLGQRHSACRSGPARTDPAGPLHAGAGEILRRRARDRFRPGARPRGSHRADGGRHRGFHGTPVSPQLVGLPGAARRRRGRRPGDGVQCADRRGDIRSRGAGAEVRTSHRHRGACGIGDGDRGRTLVPRRCARFPGRGIELCSRRIRTAVFRAGRDRGPAGCRLQPCPARHHRRGRSIRQIAGRASRRHRSARSSASWPGSPPSWSAAEIRSRSVH